MICQCVVINDNKLRLHVEEGSRDLLTGPPVHPPRPWSRFRFGIWFGIRLVVGVQIVRGVNIVVTRRTILVNENARVEWKVVSVPGPFSFYPYNLFTPKYTKN